MHCASTAIREIISKKCVFTTHILPVLVVNRFVYDFENASITAENRDCATTETMRGVRLSLKNVSEKNDAGLIRAALNTLLIHGRLGDLCRVQKYSRTVEQQILNVRTNVALAFSTDVKHGI